MAVFFTADSHFGHRGILRLAGRPFESVDAMDAALTEAWNAVVAPEDVVFHLGDFCFKGTKVAERRLERLNGRITLIRGNHDTPNSQKLPRWEAVHDILELTLEGRRLVLCHYPMLEWHGVYSNALHLHGHTHGRTPPTSLRLDVGADVWNYRPVGLPEILARAAAAPEHDPARAYAPAGDRLAAPDAPIAPDPPIASDPPAADGAGA